MHPSTTPPRAPRLGYLSPLRYPGGKARVAPYIASLIRAQKPRPQVYAEPFAGGAGAALRLLVDGVVEAIRINDLDPGVAAMWRCIFGDASEFLDRLDRVEVEVKTWQAQREVYLNPSGQPDIELGFATFFLNRCNRSGILNARPIGGLEQTGRWKIDARFNRDDLASRIRFLTGFGHRVKVTQLDARQFLAELEHDPERYFVYVDPPYIVQGDDLYLDRLSFADHKELADQLLASRLRWFMTYDCDDRITDELYPNVRCARFNISHTAQHQHVGREYAVFSDSLVVPDLNILPRDESEWVVA